LDEEIEPDSIAIIVVRWEFAENLGLFEVLDIPRNMPFDIQRQKIPKKFSV